jgi:hypothetical protein
MTRKAGSGEVITVGNTTVKLYSFKRGERTIYSLNNYLEGKPAGAAVLRLRGGQAGGPEHIWKPYTANGPKASPDFS